MPSRRHGQHIWLIDKPDAVQTQIRVGRLGIRRADPDYLPLDVTNHIFGGSYNSRLNTEVRIKKGLTYGASSALTRIATRVRSRWRPTRARKPPWKRRSW